MLQRQSVAYRVFASTLLLGVVLAGGTPSYAATECIAYLQYTDGYWQVWLMDEHGKYAKQVTHSDYDKSRLSWYPDGTALLINSNDGALFRADAKSGVETKIDIGFKGMFDAVLSPDGQSVSFGLSTSGSRDEHNIWRVDLNTKEARKLTQMNQMQHLPVWSVDSEWVYFSSKTNDQHNDILKVHATTKQLETITGNALYNFDGIESVNNEILFSSNRTGKYQLWKQDAQGRLSQLTQHPGKDARPNWSADGMKIAFESSRQGKMNVWTLTNSLPKEGGKNVAKQLTRAEVGARFPIWSPGPLKELCE